MIRIVVTAFTAFGGMTANPTIELTRRLVEGSNNRLRRVVMPTSYRASEGILDRIVSRRPDVLVMFGYTSETDRLRLEHVARNRDGSPFPDNDGRYGRRFVIPGAPGCLPQHRGVRAGRERVGAPVHSIYLFDRRRRLRV